MSDTEKLPGLLEVDMSDFEKLISSFIQRMGFKIESSTRTPAGEIIYTAKTVNPMGGEIKSLVLAEPHEEDVTEDRLEELHKRMLEEEAARAAYITTSDFTADAVEYAKGKPISLINKFQLIESLNRMGIHIDKELHDLLERHGLTEFRFKNIKHLFEVGKTMKEAKSHFSKKRKKKSLGMFGSLETVNQVKLVYAPTSIFKVDSIDTSGARHVPPSVIGHDDYLFVNLANADLFYIIRKRRAERREYALMSTDVLRRILNLPEDAYKHLIDLIDHGELPGEDLEGKELSILKSNKLVGKYETEKMAGPLAAVQNWAHVVLYVVQELFDLVTIVIHDITGTAPEDISRELHQVEASDAKPMITARIPMPHLKGGLYDLGKFFELKRGAEVKFDEDRVRYPSKKIAGILGKILYAVVEPRGLVFMPYYAATFEDPERHTIRREYLPVPQPKIEEPEKKKKKRKIIKAPKRKQDVGFEGIPYKIVK